MSVDLDASDVIDDFAETYTLVRRPTPHVLVGRAVPATPIASMFRASVQPASGRDLLRLPEGQRSTETCTIYTSTRLYVATQGWPFQSDLVLIDGIPWEVQQVATWPGRVGYYKALAQAVGGDQPMPTVNPPRHTLLVSVYLNAQGDPVPLFQAATGVAPLDWTAGDGGSAQCDRFIGLVMESGLAGGQAFVMLAFQQVNVPLAWPVGSALWALPTGIGLFSAVTATKWSVLLGTVQDGGALLLEGTVKRQA